MTEPVPAGMVDPAKLKIHPAAELFPMLKGAEFDALVEDIRKNGLQKAIVLDRDCEYLLDGRNRREACQLAGQEMRFERHLGPETPFELIISLNVRRRHLNESQRAMVAARLIPQLKTFEKGADGSLNLGTKGRPTRAGALLNVSKSSVEFALRVLKSENQDLVQAVDSGRLKVSTASRQLRPESAERPAPSAKPITIPELGSGDVALVLWGPAAKIGAALTALQSMGVRYRRVGE